MEEQYRQYGHWSTWPIEWQVAVAATHDPSIDISGLPSLWRNQVVQCRREASGGMGNQPGPDPEQPQSEESESEEVSNSGSRELHAPIQGSEHTKARATQLRSALVGPDLSASMQNLAC